MKKLTIAELREKEIEILVGFKTDNPTEVDYREARRNMNSFYRLCGLSEKIYILLTMSVHATKEAHKKVKNVRKNGIKDLTEFSLIHTVWILYIVVTVLPSEQKTVKPGLFRKKSQDTFTNNKEGKQCHGKQNIF